MRTRSLLIVLSLSLAPAPARAQGHADATPTAWHNLARAESLLTAPEPPHPVTVCVVDSGVNLTPDLAPVVIERLAYDGGDPGDTYPQEGIDDGHGTYVATFLAGQVNGWGGAGTWPRAKIVSVRVFPPGGVRARVADYIRALETCRQVPEVKVINLSLGDVDGTATQLAELEDRMTDYREKGNINVVAAAGNRGGDVEVPARFGSAFAVAAVQQDGSLCSFSARGAEVDLLAPGCNLAGADQQGRSAQFNGTSFAAPMVSAAIASVRAYSAVSAADAERLLLENSDRGADGSMLNVDRVLKAIGVLAPEPEKTPQLHAPTTGEPVGETHAQYPASWRALPAPRALVVYRQRRRALAITVKNRPRGSAVAFKVGRLEGERELSRIQLRARVRAKSVRLRFIDDFGASRWRTFRVRLRSK